MLHDDFIHVPGEIIGLLGEAAFRVRLPNGYVLVAHVTRRLKSGLGPLAVGDPVDLELSPFDLSRGRIIGRAAPATA
jgi:translation initiation factor IF-1